MRTDDVDCVYVRELLETGAESEDEAHEAVRKSVVEAIANRVPAVNVMDTAELRHRDNSKSHEECSILHTRMRGILLKFFHNHKSKHFFLPLLPS